MHISEGVLSAPVLISGGVACVASLAYGLKRLPTDRLVSVAIFSATFFVASLVHVPVGPSSVHLILNGLIGLILGWVAFPAIFIGLLMQALLFQFGGLTVLGCNTVNMALPAVIFGLAARPFLTRGRISMMVASFLCGMLSVFGAALLVALCMFFTNEGFLTVAKLLILSEIPVSVVEGLVTMLTVSFLMRSNPEILLGDRGNRTMFMNKLCLRPLLLLALAFLTIPAGPGSANAHRINIFALAETGQVRAECRFSRSAPAQDCPVTVFDADSGKVLLEGRTDKSGLFIFPIKNDYLHFPHGLRIRINAGEGHENECLVDHSELAAAASASAATQTSLTRDARTPLSADRTSPAASREQTASTATASALSMSRQELEDLVTRAVDKRITPLRVMLSAQVEKGPGLTEILGGIGWILGLFGVWALCTARRK